MLSYFTIPMLLWAAVCLFAYSHGGHQHLLVSGIGAIICAALLIIADVIIFIKSRNHND